jgi:YidC/Oxa1 family membrane protein insertase
MAGTWGGHAYILPACQYMGSRGFSSEREKESVAEAASRALETAAATPLEPAQAQMVSLSVSEGAGVVAADLVGQLGNWPSDHALRLIELLHDVSGLPYWATIVASTLVLRSVLFPLTIVTAQNAARMTLMKPEMEAISERMKRVPPGDREAQKT